MAATRKSGATAPAPRPVKVRGIKFTVDEGFMDSWEAFELLRAFNDGDVDVFGKFDLSLRLIEAATGVTKDDIVKAAGGEKAPAIDVVEIATEIVQAIIPKN